MKKTLVLAALVALFAVATASARNASASGASVAASSVHADDHGSGHDGSDDRGGDHGNHGQQGEGDGGHRGDDDGDRREAGEDVRGNCDEAEHANDAACLTAVTRPSTPTTTNTDASRRKHKSGRRAAAKQLVATVGPGFAITLETAAGAAVKTLPAGSYTVVVRDRSDEHNFHLSGRGLDKTTSVGAVSTSTWRVRLTAGTYTFKCDPHAQVMRGSIRVA